MAMHDHRGAIADENAVNGSFGKKTGEGVVVTRDHGKLAAFALRLEEILRGCRILHGLGTCLE
jgi:hypothetical protein